MVVNLTQLALLVALCMYGNCNIYFSFRKCCTGSSPQRPHQTLQHEILPLRPESLISAVCQRDQVKTHFIILHFKPKHH